MIRLIKIKKIKNKYELNLNVNGMLLFFYSHNINKSHLYNILATLASICSFVEIKRLNENIFLKFKTPNGRGDISKIKFKDKKIYLIDETYNSNPLSLKTAIENYDKINVLSNKSKKYLILGDMLELGKHSVEQHKLISKIVNKTKINQVYVIGKYIKETFKRIELYKKAKILKNKSDIIDVIDKDLSYNDYLMIKGSNSTGLHKISSHLKKRGQHVI